MHRQSVRRRGSQSHSRAERPSSARSPPSAAHLSSTAALSSRPWAPSIPSSSNISHPNDHTRRQYAVPTSRTSTSENTMVRRSFDRGFAKATTFEIPVSTKAFSSSKKGPKKDQGQTKPPSKKPSDTHQAEQHILQRVRGGRIDATKASSSPFPTKPTPPKRYKLAISPDGAELANKNERGTSSPSSSSSSRQTDKTNSTGTKSKSTQQKFILPPGMTPDQLNSMNNAEIARILGIDMTRFNSMNDDTEDQFETRFDEDKEADFAPPQSLPINENGEDPRYIASRIPGRHTINMMPTMAPRPADFKGRLTLTQKLPPRFESIQKGLRKTCQAMLNAQGLKHFDLAVTLVSAQGMQNINRQHRGENRPTDVLAFPMEDSYAEGVPVEMGNIADLGEIMLCVPYIYAQAAIRHAMLRELGVDLSDSKRPISQLEQLQKALNTVSNITVGKDGHLKLEMYDDIEDVDANSGFEFNTTAHRLKATPAASLPPITLAAIQLDNLPPFDHEALQHQIVQNQKVLGEVFNESQSIIQHSKGQLPSNQYVYDPVKITSASNPATLNDMALNHSNTSSPGVPMGQPATTVPLQPQGEGLSTHQTNELSVSRSVGSITTGYPPHNYFRHITREMVRDEMNIVLLHGLLHLIGYDHHTASARAKMQRETDRMVQLLVERGVFSERCGQLASLYVLEDAPDDDAVSNGEEMIPIRMLMSDDEKATAYDVAKQYNDRLSGKM